VATYKQIQDCVKREYGYTVKTCWIAHVKELCGLDPRVAPNRGSNEHRSNPCPPEKVAAIKEGFRHFGMI